MDGTRYPASKEFTWSEIEVIRYLALPYRTFRLRALTGANLPIDPAIDTEMVCEVGWGVKSSGKARSRSAQFGERWSAPSSHPIFYVGELGKQPKAGKRCMLGGFVQDTMHKRLIPEHFREVLVSSSGKECTAWS
jgi:hypothetical protein